MLEPAMKRILLVGLLLTCVVAPCIASTVEFGPHAAYLFGDDLGKSPQAFGLHLTFNSPWIVSAQVFTTRVGTSFEDLAIPNPDGGNPLGTVYVDGWVSGGSLILRTPPVLHSYVYIGGGMDYSAFRADVPNKVKFSVDPTTGFHALAGAYFVLGRRLTIFAEYRHFLGPGVSGEWESAVGGPGDDEEEDSVPPAVIFTGKTPSHRLEYGAVKLGLSFGL